MNTQSCPECGMEKDTWPNKAGVTKNGKTYCCRGCAYGKGCTCPQPSGASKSSHSAQTHGKKA